MSNNGGHIVPYRQFLQQGLKGQVGQLPTHFFSDFTYFDPNKMIGMAKFKVSPTKFLRASYASVEKCNDLLHKKRTTWHSETIKSSFERPNVELIKSRMKQGVAPSEKLPQLLEWIAPFKIYGVTLLHWLFKTWYSTF